MNRFAGITGQTAWRRSAPGAARSWSRLLLLLCCLGVFSGCATSRLPDYAAPTVSFVKDQDMDMSDVISYRKLTRDDFRGTEPPSDFDERMAAVTCVYTQPLVDKEAIVIEPVYGDAGEQVYEVTYNNLRYRALMNRNCSWWNQRVNGLEEDYVLEHEQIHFALFEASAREWNREPPLRIRVKLQDRSAMKEEVMAQFEAQMQRRLAELREENLRFDEDTSVGHDPERQQEWLERVMARIQQNADMAAPALEGGCEIDPATRESIENARALTQHAADRAAAGALLQEAEAAAKPPECDNVRARILADKLLELNAE